MATSSLLVGTFNDPGSDLGAPPSSHGLVTTTGWPTAPEVTHGSGPDGNRGLNGVGPCLE